MRHHNNGETYKLMKEKLIEFGYHVDERVLNTSQYGNVPQNRERLFIVGFLNENEFNKFEWPAKKKLKKTIDDIINWSGVGIDEKYYYSPQLKCWDCLNHNMEKKHIVYQYRRVYVRENKNGLCPTLTANMGTGGHNVPLIRDDNNRIRKLTPRECLLFQGFPESFKLPDELSDSKIYKQAGNSVSVTVIKRIAQNIIKALDDPKS